MPENIPQRRVGLSGKQPVLIDPTTGRPFREGQVSRAPDREFYSPADPLPAREPRLTEPRGLIPRFGQNLNITPRSDWTSQGTPLTSFEALRALGTFDYVAIAIEDVKGQIIGMDWSCQPKPEFKASLQAQRNADVLKRWAEQPDPLMDLDFEEWLDTVIQEVLVTDALTLYPHFTIGGQPIGLEQIDGATIRPLVDIRGRKPLPPAPAYQQIVQGIPETEFSMLELWYLPMNRRVDSPYGMSPTEKVIFTVNVAVRASDYDLSYYTDGSLPSALYSFPASWTADEITEYQQMWNDVQKGNVRFRSGDLRMIPDGKLHIVPERPWQYAFYEWLARVVAWSFGVSPLPIAKMMNRSTSETLELSSTESGVRPRAKRIARILNRYATRCLGIYDAEFRWGGEEEEDPATTTARNTSHATLGAVTPDELREDAGRDPLPAGLGERPIVQHPTHGFMYLDEAIEAGRRSAAAPAAAAPAGAPAASGGATPARVFPVAATAGDDEPLEQRISRWKRAALERHRKGRGQRPWTDEAIPHTLRLAIEHRLRSTRTATEIRALFDTAMMAARTAAASLRKTGEPEIPAQDLPRGLIAEVISRWLRANAPDLIDEAMRAAATELPEGAPGGA